ncbi:hypothetical protein LOTGIDRAFT_233771 [Lottia gigantea]|uniref:Armadillo repeat-containing domain-containing protein n=1 Tax=Lottia gigantea TaxID=225164 RepID=V4BNN8_LOTGI|nr:hypothetical protein LOTGIDRAFT_233771 [Lottia gigantea]ESO90489.1 hypothetical protein LOTGIDRAFT_233771 [Lottia gigantea]
MASKDITKVVLAGTAVVGLVVIYYLYTKRSKLQDGDKKQGTKTKEKSPVKIPQTQTADKQDVPEKKPELGQTKPKPESKIPQKIQSKAQGVVKPSLSEGSPAVSKPELTHHQDDIKAGGETVTINKKDQEIQNTEPVKKTELSAEQPKEEIVSPVVEKKKESTATPVAAVQPVPPQPSTVEQQQLIQESDRQVYNAHNSQEVSIKSEASIILNSPPVSQQTVTTINKTSSTENSTESPVKTDENGIEAPPQAASKPGLDVERITQAIQLANSNPGSIDKETLDTLVMLLRQKDIPLLQASLDCIVRCGAYSQNQSLLRESGCIQELTILLQIHAVAARTGSETSQKLLGSLNNAIINLCMDIQNQARLEVCIPVLIDLITYERSPEDVQLMSLKSLTNLSTTPSYHDQYMVAIPRLYSMMDGINSSIRLQAVKVLVNLSCNPEIIPALLESKTPRLLLKCLEPQTDSILLLRVVTLMVNLVSCIKEGKITEEQLPALDNPANAGTIYMTLFGENESAELKMRIQNLTRHSTDNCVCDYIVVFVCERESNSSQCGSCHDGLKFKDRFFLPLQVSKQFSQVICMMIG